MLKVAESTINMTARQRFTAAGALREEFSRLMGDLRQACGCPNVRHIQTLEDARGLIKLRVNLLAALQDALTDTHDLLVQLGCEPPTAGEEE